MSEAPNNLAALRERIGLTQRKLGDRMEVHWVTISKLERGQMQLTETWLKKFALALGCKPAEILKDDRGSDAAPHFVTANIVIALRRHVFQVRQAEFARIAGVGQASISRWENGESCPTLENLRTIRAEAARRGIPWDHEWLFGALPLPAGKPSEACA